MEFCRVFQKVDDFFDLFLGLIAARDVCKSDRISGLIKHTGLGLAKTESPALATTLHLAHEIHPDTDQQQHGAPTDQQGHKQGAFFARFDVELDVVGNQVTHQTPVEVSGVSADTAVVIGNGHNIRATLAFLDGDGFNVFITYFI